MTSPRWILAFCFSLASVLGTGESVTTTETQKYTCRTFGSGVIQPFNGSIFYVRSNCPFTLTRFTHNRVECDIATQRDDSGLLVQVEIIINKIKTVLQNGSILVEKNSVSLPYDHTYQHVFQYGVYTKLKSSLLPLSVTWHNVPGGIDTVWVELEQELSTDMSGLCGKHNIQGNKQQLITDSVLTDDTCQTRDPVFRINQLCRLFFSYTLDCLQARTPHYTQLCEENIYSYETSKYIGCAFFKEVVQQCGNSSYVWNIWRSVTSCARPSCPGDLVYVEQGAAFVPSCSNPNPRFSYQDLTSSCVCPMGKVLNDLAEGFHCVSVSSCPCVFSGKSYSTGSIRKTKCQSCTCDSGKWRCSKNSCPPRCTIEGQFVTTVDGKQYVLPGKCTYVASQGLNWTITVEFSKKEPSLKTVILELFKETYTFSHRMAKIGEKEITELHLSDHALVFWQSSMYVQVHTSIGMKIQVQTSPEIQLYITPPPERMISGLCGNNNNDTTDDFTTSSGIVENSAQPFAQSWSVDACTVNIPSTCINTDNEIFADDKCSVLNNPTGIFAKCHAHIPTDHYHMACIQRTCNCGNSLQQCLCVSLGSYAKACASLGVVVGDWRKATNCTLKCLKNQQFSYNIKSCNRTCRSLSGPDPRCVLDDAPVEGCGCPEGTHLNQEHTCTPKAECVCHYYGRTVPPGSVVIDGRKCICENGEMNCSKDCGCKKGMVCVHCAEYQVNTAQKTCDSLSKPTGSNMTCTSGCYCPYGKYEDHRGNCVSVDNCTCVYSGKVFGAGQSVKTNCKTCICGQGQWRCKDEPCPGKCQVYGNGHYQTFDSKWYRFDGHCQYTLVEDECGSGNGTFSVRVESVPCCDEALTCSRSIVLDLQGAVTLTLSDMKVSRRHYKGWTLQANSLYSTHTVGLYIIISVPRSGITLIWDKHTRITIELHEKWRNQVCGLCGNFDFNEMNDLQISGSAVVSSPLSFGNSWKSTTPPCSDVRTEIFPCQRNSYCSAWAQRRCMILKGGTFKECHLKVDPEPYYHACVQESCSCEFEGKFLGFCTAVAAYAEACSDQDVCVNWRTPDMCPVYCDYYNEQGQCSWHYEACGKMQTCGKGNYITHKLEGCYPRCSKEAPFYDENTGECTKLSNCTCYFNDTIIQPGAVVLIQSIKCQCENGTIHCQPVFKTPDLNSTSTPTAPPLTTTPVATPTSSTPTTTSSATSETTVPPTTSTSTTASAQTAEMSSTMSPITSMPLTTITNVSTTTENWSTVLSSTSTPNATTTSTSTSATSTPMTTITNDSTSTENWSTVLSITPKPTATTTSAPPETVAPPTTSTSTTTSALTSAERHSTMPPTITMPVTTITNFSATTENWSTVSSSASTGATTTTSTTTETWSAKPSTTSTPMTTITNDSTSTENWSTVLSTTATPTATTTSAPPETAAPPTTSASRTTRASSTAETWSTMPQTTSLQKTTITNVSTTIEQWSTVFPSTSTPTATSTSAPTDTTVLSTNSTPITTTAQANTETIVPSTTSTSLATVEIWSTMPPNTSMPMTTITNVSTTTGTVLSTTSAPGTSSATIETTVLSTTFTHKTNISTTAVTSVTHTEETNTTAKTSSTPTTSSATRISTSPSETTATSTPLTTITNSTESTTEQTTTTELPASESPSSAITTLYTTLSTLFTDAPKASTAESVPTKPVISTDTFKTQPTTRHTEPTTTSFATRATAINSGPTEVTITEAPTTSFTHSTTQPTTTFSEATSPGDTSKSTMMPPTTYPTEISTREGLTNADSTTELMTPNMTETESTYHTSVSTTQPKTSFTSVSRKPTIVTETGTSLMPTIPTSSQSPCECKDRNRGKSWSCGETWTEDCFKKTCINGKLELTPVVCPEPTIPNCPRKQVTKVSDGCCETLKCDCRCELYGDPHYISFQGVTFDFLDECTYILVEEQSPHHNLTIAVDNFLCVPGLKGSCAKGVFLSYQNNIAALTIIPHLFTVKATLNNVTIEPPYEEQGWRFETTGYIVTIRLPEVRSYVSLSPSWTLVVSLAMEHFQNNTQGQCGVCGGGSCIRKGGLIEDDSCCDKTAYDWVHPDPQKPACVSAPRDIPCNPGTTQVPATTPTPTPSCPASQLCGLLHHPVFSNCSRHVNLNLYKKSCEFDSCRSGACSSLEQAAKECKRAGFCIDWRRLTNGSCNVTCPKGLVYNECSFKQDDFCYGGLRYPGAALDNNSTGCFCPSGLFRAGNHSNICVSQCPYCKGPLGEPRLPGEVWRSGCKYLCKCNNQTRMEECFPKPSKPTPICSPDAVLVNTTCCGDQICVKKTCSYLGKTLEVGDRWKDAAHPCKSFRCSREGVQTETRVCPTENCQEEDKIWDDQHCCFTCNQSCAPKLTSINFTVDNCSTVMQMPVCQGQCVSEPRVVLDGDLQVEQEHRCCQERRSERRSVTLQCFDLTSRHYAYRHITGCECRACGILR